MSTLYRFDEHRTRREEPLGVRQAATSVDADGDPAHEAVCADSIGGALLRVLDTLTPAESLAFVLHDMFDVPFDVIAAITRRSPTAARQLAHRARRRMRATDTVPGADLTRRRAVVTAFLAASRHGEFDALLRVLCPNIDMATARWMLDAGRAG